MVKRGEQPARRASGGTDGQSSRWAVWLALCASAALHGMFGWLGSVLTSVPALDVEFAVPLEVELGFAESVTVDPATGTPDAPPPTGDEVAPPTESKPEAAGPNQPETRQPTAPEQDDADASAPADAGPPSDGSTGNDAPVELPAGTQIALRVDMSRIRRSPLADDIRGLIAAIPDWQAILAGSGIDPVEQLDRLLIATPDLSREKVVIAGRYLGEVDVVQRAVGKLSESAGVDAPFHTERGVTVARWANPDRTERIVALIGPSHFVISRRQDLPKILGIARVRSTLRNRGDAGSAETTADALLAMPDRAGLSIEVEGVQQFVRRTHMEVPARATAAALESENARIDLSATLSFADAAAARRARDFWDEKRDLYARNALVTVLGLDAPLDAASLRVSERDLRVEVSLSVNQARLLLGYLRELVQPPSTRARGKTAP